MNRARRRDERGATAVVVAFAMVMLLSFAAVAVDVGGLWWDRKQLQNGADAGAIAIAQACAAGSCGDTATDATHFAQSNKLDGNATGQVVSLTANSVTVQTASTRQLWFANIMGVGSAPVSARATAKWGPYWSGSSLPVSVSLCWFYYQTGSTEITPPPTNVIYTIPLMSNSTVSNTALGPSTCGTQAAHNEAAGAFGFLSTNSSCQAIIDSNGWVSGDQGYNEPNCMSATFHDGDTILIPIFDAFQGNGASGNGGQTSYHVWGFAGFKITQLCFGSADAAWPGCKNLPAPLTGQSKNISGYFTGMFPRGSDSSSCPAGSCHELGTFAVWLSQ